MSIWPAHRDGRREDGRVVGKVIAINLAGIWLCTKQALRHMRQQSCDASVHTASLGRGAGECLRSCGQQAWRGTSDQDRGARRKLFEWQRLARTRRQGNRVVGFVFRPRSRPKLSTNGSLFTHVTSTWQCRHAASNRCLAGTSSYFKIRHLADACVLGSPSKSGEM